MKKISASVFLLALALLSTGHLYAAEMTAEEVMKRSQAAFYYPAADFKARVMMRLVSREGSERVREMTMIRKNYGPPGGEQKYFIYFHLPSDVRSTAFLVHKHPAKDDDRWLFIPALNMVRRVAAKDKRSSFVGSDFTYEDVSGRDVGDDTHEFIKAEETPGSPCAVKECHTVKSSPKGTEEDYSYRISRIDKTTFLPLKEEYYDRKGEIYKVFTADEIKDVKGFPTVLKRTMKNLQSGHSTAVDFTKIDYNTGVKDSLFSERYLKAPPRSLLE